MIGILMLPIPPLDKIKVFSQDLLPDRARKAAADGQDWNNQGRAGEVADSVSQGSTSLQQRHHLFRIS